MLKAIIFDCFGVLVGTGYWKTFERAGGNLARDKRFLDDILYKSSSGTITSGELLLKSAERLGIPLQDWKNLLHQDEKPNRELFTFIEKQLKPKYKIGFLSNVARGGINDKIPGHLLELFDTIVVSAEVGLAKPDPEIFELTADRLGVAPAGCLFVDDNEPYLAGAQSVGMKTHLFKDTASFISMLNDTIL